MQDLGYEQADPELVEAVQAGSPDAFTHLYRRHHLSVRRTALNLLRDPDEAEEVAQAAFVRAFERIAQCDGDRRFGPWVNVIARRLCLDLLRARARQRHEPGRSVPLPAASGGPEESLLHQEEVRSLLAALDTLSDRQRQAVMARAVEDRPPREIAASLGLTTAAVDSLLFRARRRLAVAYRRKVG